MGFIPPGYAPPPFPKTTPNTSEPQDVKVKDIKAGKILVDALHRTSPEIAAKYKRSSLRPGDLLLSIRGTYGRIASVPDTLDGANITQDTARLAIVPEVRADFISYQLISDEIQNFFKRVARGVAVKGVNIGDVKRTPIKLAPLAEQQRIVTELDTQFTRLDVGIAGLLRVRANLKRYRASVLKAACEGRLVPTEAELARAEGRDYEPADRLLARILQERRARWEADHFAKMQAPGKRSKDDKWKSKYQEAVRAHAAGLPIIPEGWTWASIGQITSLVTSGSRGWAEHYSCEGPLFIRAQDINTDRLELGAVAHVNLPPGIEGARTRVQVSDLLVTVTGANVTKSAIVRVELSEAYVSQHVGLVRPVLADCADYMYIWIVSPTQGRGELERLAYGAGKPGLNLDNLRELLLALPPLAEQKRIVAEVERRLSLLDDLESVVSANLKRAERLRQAILKRAFEGKLVPQDPDELAGVLLERIMEDRSAPLNPTQGVDSVRTPEHHERGGATATQASLFPDVDPPPRSRRSRRA